MTAKPEGDIILGALAQDLKTGRATIDWDPYPAGYGHGKVTFRGIKILISEADIYGTLAISLVEPPTEGNYRERLVPLRASNALVKWQVNRAVRASFKAFKTALRARQESADLEAMRDAINKLHNVSQGSKEGRTPQEDHGLPGHHGLM